jgi:hypothetical protein
VGWGKKKSHCFHGMISRSATTALIGTIDDFECWNLAAVHAENIVGITWNNISTECPEKKHLKHFDSSKTNDWDRHTYV